MYVFCNHCYNLNNLKAIECNFCDIFLIGKKLEIHAELVEGSNTVDPINMYIRHDPTEEDYENLVIQSYYVRKAINILNDGNKKILDNITFFYNEFTSMLKLYNTSPDILYSRFICNIELIKEGKISGLNENGIQAVGMMYMSLIIMYEKINEKWNNKIYSWSLLEQTLSNYLNKFLTETSFITPNKSKPKSGYANTSMLVMTVTVYSKMLEELKKITDIHTNKEVIDLIKLEANKGNQSIQCDLGFLYRDGRGVDQDYKEAFRYFKLAADQGDVLACSTLGYAYAYG